MGKIISSDRVVLWAQENGNSTPFIPFAVGERAAGMTGKSIPGTTTTPVYSRDANGRPLLIKQNLDVPGGTPSATLSVYERGQIDILRKSLERGCPLTVQSRIVECGSLVNPNAWSAIDHWSNGIVGDYSMGDAPSLGFDGTEISNEASVTFDNVVRILQTSLSALTIAETEDLLDIAGLTEEQCNSCGNGYPGADQILLIGAAAGAAAIADSYISVNGGGTWTVLTNQPFAADEDISDVEMFMLGNTQMRILMATDTTDVAAKAKFAYGTATLGDEASVTLTNVLIAGTANGDVITTMKQATFDRTYFATTGGDIYVSTDQGVSDPGASIYTGSAELAGFAVSPDESQVWAFGASNTLLLETDGSGTFVSRTAPSGGGAFTALTEATDGTISAGNGTSLFMSTDNANSTGNWTELKDFGTNMSVVSIQTIKGESQLLRVVVTDSTGGGSVWQSVDGGATFVQITTLTNTGYGSAYFSTVDANKAVIVGAAGKVHALLPA